MALTWAGQRRLIISLIVGAFLLIIAAGVFYVQVYQTTSCSDGRQNQGETGVDCGGPCPYLCVAGEKPPVVLFTQLLRNNSGRIDLIAEIENKNLDAAAKNVPYTISLYPTDHSTAREITGTVDLPPRATVPLFIPGVATSDQSVAQAFLDIAPTAPRWFTFRVGERTMPVVSSITTGGTDTAPRVDAVLTNPSATRMSEIHAIALLYGPQGNVIAASETVVPIIAPFGQATATFSWNDPFSGSISRREVIPIVPLP